MSSSEDTPADSVPSTELPGQGLASSAEDVRAMRSTTARVQSMANIRSRQMEKLRKYTGRLAYRYFNWRQDTWNDLQLFATFNTILLIIATVLKTNVVDVLDKQSDAPTSSFQHFWQSLYDALVVVVGQDLPDSSANILQQLWSLMVAAIGLAAFALVLALVEQVVLEVLKNNVQRGSQVYENGHVRVLLSLALHIMCTLILTLPYMSCATTGATGLKLACNFCTRVSKPGVCLSTDPCAWLL